MGKALRMANSDLLKLLGLIVIGLPSFAMAQPALTPAWTVSDAQALLGVIDRVDEEGLNPSDYDPTSLRKAILGGDPTTISFVATRLFDRLAADEIQGRVRGKARVGWFMSSATLDPAHLNDLLTQALAGHQVGEALATLLPTDPEYRALKVALAAVPQSDFVGRNRLRVNLERWRWMPRKLGSRYLLVNTPQFVVDLVDGGNIVARHRVVVGRRASPTPQFATAVTGVILNPSWYVPKSIVAEGIGAMVRHSPEKARALGYIGSKSVTGALQVRQLPGPKNALGQMKLVMPNNFTVYLHDTPSKALFENRMRGLSHGCIRVDKAIDFVTKLLAPVSGWDRTAIDAALAGAPTTKVDLFVPIPIYITYLTARAENGAIVLFGDPYGRDAAVIAALDGKPLSKPGP